MAGSEYAGADSDWSRADRPSWRQLNRRLWVGHDGTTSLGTIEQGVRYVYVDADGEARRGFRTLDEAQSAATGPVQLPVRHGPEEPRRPRLAVLIHSAVLLAGLAILVVAIWMAGWALVVSS